MLGKTANGLFWMYRYLERAENVSRLVETGQRIALTRSGESDEDWQSVLQSAGVTAGFHDHYDAVTKDTVIDWMLRAKGNPSSVLNCIGGARQNARLVRTALTGEVWEGTNAIYMGARDMLARKVGERDLPNILRRIRQQTALVRGATHGTMLRNDIYDFCRIGTFLERADNTTRILDVKYYVLLPSVMAVGTDLDNVQWETILRSVSARGGFRMEFGNQFEPRDIASFLILDRRFPRSLGFCVDKLRSNMEFLGREYGNFPRAHGMVVDMSERHLSRDIDEIFDYGLHEFVQETLNCLGALGQQIEIDYRFYE
ncbi:alpha-E domain-containing protein [Pseudoponticoccus marisrubri]|uniref:A alpha-helical domain with a conserved ER moti n=1 Tax=Pseudoponticoccus marisrubri TaxID=1685382 RepID=A0A0W7WPD6_9RHOB|nr:alpha-E domain-containing protein [Pseudoponticoccus marisrubri]KUF12466.1 A alpha-helical domain with a conserved ER moti [Pseudoponticoccus marisrubri]